MSLGFPSGEQHASNWERARTDRAADFRLNLDGDGTDQTDTQ
jgi:hypothetical protein